MTEKMTEIIWLTCYQNMLRKRIMILILQSMLRESSYVKVSLYLECKCQYKIVGFLSYKNVGKPTRLYDILCNLIFLNHILPLIL